MMCLRGNALHKEKMFQNGIKKNFNLKLVITLICILQSPSAYAYIDPGTGSALVYVVTGIVVSAYFAMRSLYYRIIELFFRIRFKYNHCSIAVHSEDPRYEISFMPILEELVKHGVDVTYFTMYERNASFDTLPPGVLHVPIPAGMVGYAYLNNLRATVLATTTIQLDVMIFKRSKNVKHYVAVSHALGESRYVRPFAYDYFDSVFCCGPILKNNIRKMEKIRGLPSKRLFETGIPHYQSLITYAEHAQKPGKKCTVLISPSWGPLSMFETIGTDFIKNIADHFNVIIRPHPQMKISQPELYQQILLLDNVVVDTARTPSESMSKSHIMLSDISSIVYEFAFIYQRPALIIDQEQYDGGLEAEVLGNGPTLKESSQSFIIPFPPVEIDGIADKIKDTLFSYSAQGIAIKRDELLYNFDRGATTAALQLIELYQHEYKKIIHM